MEIQICIDESYYQDITVSKWQSVWEHVCKMAYEGTDICEEIITKPNGINMNSHKVASKGELVHAGIYEEAYPFNKNEVTLDYMWKKYSDKHGTNMPRVVSELKRLHVPQALFENLGVKQWFQHSFPNCVITYWGF